MSDVVKGVDWASSQAQKKAADAEAEFAAKGSTKHKGSVANMSLGGGKSRSLDEAVNAAVDYGLHFAVAAGMSTHFKSDHALPTLPPFFKEMTTAMHVAIHQQVLRKL